MTHRWALELGALEWAKRREHTKWARTKGTKWAHWSGRTGWAQGGRTRWAQKVGAQGGRTEVGAPRYLQVFNERTRVGTNADY